MECRLNEMYECILGEGVQAGLGALLVRLAGCNLDCTYCDTRYAREERGAVVDLQAIVERAVCSPFRRVLVTGGEPLLQTEACIALCEKLIDKGHEVLLETNGTVSLRGLPPGVVRVVDMKTPGAGAGFPFLGENLNLLRPGDQLKFVITDRNDYEWASAQTCRLPRQVPAENVLFSPMATGLDPAMLASWMIRDGSPYRFHLQLHKFVWGNQRGV